MTTSARVFRAALSAAAVLGVVTAAIVPSAGAAPTMGPVPAAAPVPAGQGLPLGDADLVETRTSQVLARGVTLTRIVRGTDPAPADQINTTPRGPWVVNVLTIDPRRRTAS